MAEIQHHARPLFQHVEIEAAIAEQRDALLHRATFLIGAIEIGLGLGETLIDLNPSDHAPITLNGVIDKVPGYAGTQELTKHLARATPEFATKIHETYG